MTRSIRQKAFTTIELLTAIGILVILAGLVYVGFRSVGTGGKTRSTKAALESARAMLAEIDASGGMANVKSIYQSAYPASAADSLLTTPVNCPPRQNSFPGSGTPPDPIPAPTMNVSEESYSSSNFQRYTSEAVVRTQAVMARLGGSPVNRGILSQLPPERLLRKPPSNAVQYKSVTASGAPNPPILVDAWGNPIIYVPPAGLSGVKVGASTNQVITSHRVRSTYTAGNTDPASPNYGNFDPGATSFWASAGPDGDFTTGDDNIYSFE